MLPNKLSGAQRRKLNKDKNDKESAVLKKIPKLDNFFQIRQPADSVPVSEDVSNSAHNNPYTSTSDGIQLVDEGVEVEEDATTTDVELKCNVNFSDPAKWSALNLNIIDEIIRVPIEQNVDLLDFSSSKRVYSQQARYATKKIFFFKMPNDEIRKMEWLCYSETTGTVFCFPCKLFDHRSHNVFTTEFNDWKNDVQIIEHERGFEHRKEKIYITTLVWRSNHSQVCCLVVAEWLACSR